MAADPQRLTDLGTGHGTATHSRLRVGRTQWRLACPDSSVSHLSHTLVLDVSLAKSTSLPLESFSMFPTNQFVRAKSEPTTHVTTSEINWEEALRSLVKDNLDERKEKKPEIVSVKNACSNSGMSSSSGSARRVHGLLTPHASFGNIFTEDERIVQKSGSRTGKSRDHGEDDRRSQTHSFCTETDTHNANESFDSREHHEHGSLTTREPVFSIASTSTDHRSYTSVGVQTPIRSSRKPTQPAPSSPTSRSPSITPRPKRTRSGKPIYVLEGERLARELDSDITHLAEKRQRLEKELKYVRRKEKDLQSLLIPGPVGYSDSNSGETTETESEINQPERCAARERTQTPTTPVRIDREPDITGINHCRSSIMSSQSVSSAVSSTKGSPSKYLFTPTFTNASGSSKAELAADGTTSLSESSSSHSASAEPGFTYMEGSSTSGSVTSGEVQRMPDDISDFGPSAVYDPSTYFVWFDLETNDAVRPTKHVRILEVAVCITDKNFTRLDNGVSFLVHWPLTADEVAKEMSPNVQEMHKKSGLLSEYAQTPPNKRRTLSQVERRVCYYLRKHDIQPDGRGVMAGAGVAFDRGVVHIVRRKYNRRKRFEESCAHRALEDIMGSIKEAKMYSNTVLKHPREVRWPPLADISDSAHRGKE
ncbi:hypothetical protein M0805_008396 [Coniferiporia weirii]|nr:hypothetical protein M0805_008396 [Coniferiporia weirii]